MKLEKDFATKLLDFLTDEFNNGYNTKTHTNFISCMHYAFKSGFKTSWSLGGTTGNCYGEKREASAQMETGLDQMDDFIMKNYPQISFMQYKMIERAITRDIKSDKDWYGGETQEASKQISFSTLSDVAVNVKLEEGNDYINSDEFIVQKAYVLFPEPIQENKQDVTYLNNEVEQEKKTVKKSLGIVDEKKIKKPRDVIEKVAPKALKKKM